MIGKVRTRSHVWLIIMKENFQYIGMCVKGQEVLSPGLRICTWNSSVASEQTPPLGRCIRPGLFQRVPWEAPLHKFLLLGEVFAKGSTSVPRRMWRGIEWLLISKTLREKTTTCEFLMHLASIDHLPLPFLEMKTFRFLQIFCVFSDFWVFALCNIWIRFNANSVFLIITFWLFFRFFNKLN